MNRPYMATASGGSGIGRRRIDRSSSEVHNLESIVTRGDSPGRIAPDQLTKINAAVHVILLYEGMRVGVHTLYSCKGLPPSPAGEPGESSI
jgi:hypothetical protein